MRTRLLDLSSFFLSRFKCLVYYFQKLTIYNTVKPFLRVNFEEYPTQIGIPDTDWNTRHSTQSINEEFYLSSFLFYDTRDITVTGEVVKELTQTAARTFSYRAVTKLAC